MNKYKSDYYKLGAVKYYLKQNYTMDKVCKIFDCKKSTLKGWQNYHIIGGSLRSKGEKV